MEDDWIDEYVSELLRDPLPENADRMARKLVDEAIRGNLNAERALCIVRVFRKDRGKEPIEAIERWLDCAVHLRATNKTKNWNACMRPEKHFNNGRDSTKAAFNLIFDRWEIIEAVNCAHAAGYPKSADRPTKKGTKTAFEVACESLRRRFGPRMLGGMILTPDAVRLRYQRILRPARRKLAELAGDTRPYHKRRKKSRNKKRQ
jgi:hypothetical protein